MSKYVDASLFVEMQLYDDEYEEWGVWNGTIEDLLNQWTEQGCPPTIEVSEDCISRQKAIETCDKMYPKVDRQDIKAVIEAAPSVTPTIEIIRCSECKFWDRDNVSNEGRALCQTGESGYRARAYYDFCSKAIRNEDERWCRK